MATNRRRGRPLGGNYQVYIREYNKLKARVEGKFKLDNMLSEKAYQGRYSKLRDKEKADKQMGLIGKNTSININKQILDEQQYDPMITRKSARATYKAMREFRDSLGKATFKSIRLKDIRAGEGNLDVESKQLIENFWEEVKKEYFASGKDSQYVSQLFFGSP